ncbi:methionine ABC transporter permease [Gleimia hominis]|uniref:methionine ABC transporter permease n=1 Tax=Gleimia hominis TaxID=595468 RepID=UPI000C80940B
MSAVLSNIGTALMPATASLTHAWVPLVANSDETWFNNPAVQRAFWPGVWETLAMTGLSTLFTVIIGLPLGLVLIATGRGGLFTNKPLHQVLAFIVNFGRSIPFLILMIAIIPFTRLVAGSSIGWKAAVVPLTVAAIPFFARLVETAVRSVDDGKIEAAQMMGATRGQIMRDVQVREALPAIIDAITVLAITLIGYGAMAGALGGGGLGQLAMNYGYNRFMPDVMVLAVIGVYVIVQIVQMVGDMCSRLVDHR